MSSLRFTNPDQWDAIERHLSAAVGERFAFALTETLHHGPRGPLVEVVEVLLVDDSDVVRDMDGWAISEVALDTIHNRARAARRGLVEFHNHGLGPPRFSTTDERALAPMVGYMIELLGVPYGAAVWAEGVVHAEWWRPGARGETERGAFSTILVLGERLRVLNAHPVSDPRLVRQLPLLGAAGQAAIASLRVAVVGAGGTGSHVALQLLYMGFRHVLVLDDDLVEESNLNRLVTADKADLGLPKNSVAKRRMQGVDPECRVQALPGLTPDGDHEELDDVDLIFGCVDHDGPRQRLNRIALSTRTPYIDVATGVDSQHEPVAVGGRVILARPGRPCLSCLRELDSAEVGRWAKPPEQQVVDRLHGYGTTVPNPSVVYLNGLAVSAALAEVAAWISGTRPPADCLQIDLVGEPGKPGVFVGPLALGMPDPLCVDCAPLQL